MKQGEKRTYCSVFLLFSVVITTIYQGYWQLSLLSLILLGGVCVLSPSLISYIIFSISMIAVLESSSLFFSYGFDTHSPIAISQEIINSGWPVNILYSWGDANTPLLHFHGAVTSLVTGLPLVPSPSRSVLTGTVLSIIYVITMILVAGSISHRLWSKKYRLIGILPVLFWTPLYLQKAAFRRQSIAFALFGTLVLILYFEESFKRTVLTTLLVVSIVLSHHVTSVLVILYLTFNKLSKLIESNKKRSLGEISVSLIALSGVLFVVWSLFATSELEIIVAILANSLLMTTEIQPPNETTFTFYTFIQSTLSRWTYQLVIGAGIATGFVTHIKQEYTNPYKLPFLFGIFIAISSLSLWFGKFFNAYRIISFFVISCASAGIIGYKDVIKYKSIKYRIHVEPVLKTTAIALLILSMVMIPVPEVSENNRLDEGIYDEEFSPELYAFSEFYQSNSMQKPVIADKKVMEVVTPIGQAQIHTDTSAIRSHQIPPDKVALLSSTRNSVVYSGLSGGGLRSFATINMSSEDIAQFRQSNDVIYQSGEYSLYSS